jgi:primosomal protein N' (replication factor Y)
MEVPLDSPQFCDVSLPVPLDRPFTYSLPATWRQRVQVGARVIVPFGPRKLTGMVVRLHDDAPEMATKDAMRLLDEEPLLDAALLALGRWIATYYCSPLGEVLRGMTPMAGDVRKTKTLGLTPAGRDAARQLLLGTPSEEPAVEVLRLLETRPLTSGYLLKKVHGAEAAVKALLKRGWLAEEEDIESKDPLRIAAARLRAEFAHRLEGVKAPKSGARIDRISGTAPGLAQRRRNWRN